MSKENSEMEYKSAIADIQHATSKMKKGKIGCERKRNCIARRLSNINIILCGGRRRRSSIVVVRACFSSFSCFICVVCTLHKYSLFAGAVSMLPFAI